MLKRELEMITKRPQDLIGSTLSKVNPMEEDEEQTITLYPGEYGKQPLKIHRPQQPQQIHQQPNERYSSCYSQPADTNRKSIADSIIDGNELADNETKNVPSESKCSTVRRPLRLL